MEIVEGDDQSASKENGEVSSNHAHTEGIPSCELVSSPTSSPQLASDPPLLPPVVHVSPLSSPPPRLSQETLPPVSGSPDPPPISRLNQEDGAERLVEESSQPSVNQDVAAERQIADSGPPTLSREGIAEQIIADFSPQTPSQDKVMQQLVADSCPPTSIQENVTERLVTDSSSENGSSQLPHLERIGRPASVGSSIGVGTYTERGNIEGGDFWTWLLAGLLLVLLWVASTTETCDEQCKELRRLQREVAVLQEEGAFLAQRVKNVVQVAADEALTTRELFETYSLRLKQVETQRTDLLAKLEVYEPPEVAIMTILKDESSFGEDRNISQYFDLLDSIEFPANRMSLNILVSDHGFLARMEQEMKVRAKKFRKRSLFFRDFGWSLGRSDEERHDPRWQKPRRSMLARYRNVLLQLGLKDEAHVLWVDGDMEYVPPNIVDYLRSANKDIITPRCLRGDFDYDLNTWRGPRLRPRYKYQYTHAVFVPRPSHLTEHMDKLAQLPDDFVRVDSVGGTILLVKSEVHINGALFPPFYVVGSFWDTQGGFDGIETEGLCYVAATMDYSCWGAPKITVYHHDS
eukprot:comp16480_c0_seq1/m.14451 comp16480_c0_seq1/g.14451  ORF comp16480_c0_seq1/g.14451 comp16480_c0_seq1/m.14451 type:complete len:576 (-) comp16480_c0_seq1:303-2030(-)